MVRTARIRLGSTATHFRRMSCWQRRARVGERGLEAGAVCRGRGYPVFQKMAQNGSTTFHKANKALGNPLKAPLGGMMFIIAGRIGP